MRDSKNQTPVLIVGAGPTGLVLALWLSKKKVPFRIIDLSSAPGQSSRALAVQARTLEFYRQLGIADELIKAGVMVPELIMRRKGRIAAKARLGALGKDLSPFPYLLFCSQDVHEAILCDLLKKQGVEIERQTELIDFSQDTDGVNAKLKSPRGEELVRADYLCGCDGAHSAVRHGMPSNFPGGAYSQVFFVADVEASGEMAEGGVQISLSPKDFCIVMPIKSRGTIRLTGLVPPESEIKDSITYSDVSEAVSKNTGLRVSKINWFSSYRVHHRVAEKFRKGRVFIAGDAGHIHSPAGGQGMNTGIGDAVNLAWKLADVLQGRASEKLLDSYERERMPFAHILIRTTDQAFRLIASRSVMGSIFRAYLLPAVFAVITRFKPVLRAMFRTISQIRISYRQSPLSQGASGRLRPGDRLPWVPYTHGDNFESLRSLDWQVHVYGQAQSAFKSALKTPLFEFEWNQACEKRGLLKDAVYVVRPDGHIGLISIQQDASLIEQYLSIWHF